MNLIQQLTQMKVPTDSYIAAVQNFNERARDGEFGSMVTLWNNLVDGTVPPMVETYARTQIGYLIQEAVKLHSSNQTVGVKAVAELATAKTKEYVEANPWVYAAAEAEAEPKLDVEGNVIPQRKRGAKQELAAQVFERMKGKDKKEILEAFVAEVGLTKAGAQTYYYNLRKLAAAQ